MRRVSRASSRRAVSAISLARTMMASSRSTLACFHITTTRPHRYSATLWTRQPDGAFAMNPGTTAMTQATLDEICGWLAGVAREIATQWPERARPATIGMATDGHWMVFNAAHPSCEGSAWLDEHLSGRSPAAIVARDDGMGFLSSLSEAQELQ